MAADGMPSEWRPGKYNVVVKLEAGIWDFQSTPQTPIHVAQRPRSQAASIGCAKRSEVVRVVRVLQVLQVPRVPRSDSGYGTFVDTW